VKRENDAPFVVQEYENHPKTSLPQLLSFLLIVKNWWFPFVAMYPPESRTPLQIVASFYLETVLFGLLYLLIDWLLLVL